jgi:hypothetical protein
MKTYCIGGFNFRRGSVALVHIVHIRNRIATNKAAFESTVSKRTVTRQNRHGTLELIFEATIEKPIDHAYTPREYHEGLLARCELNFNQTHKTMNFYPILASLMVDTDGGPAWLASASYRSNVVEASF